MPKRIDLTSKNETAYPRMKTFQLHFENYGNTETIYNFRQITPRRVRMINKISIDENGVEKVHIPSEIETTNEWSYFGARWRLRRKNGRYEVDWLGDWIPITETSA
jgi:hypothetical protein